MQNTCMSKQQWHRKQWSLQLAVSKLAPQVVSEQGPLPSKNGDPAFQQDPMSLEGFLSEARIQDIWARSSCWQSEPRSVMHPNGDLQSCSGSKSG